MKIQGGFKVLTQKPAALAIWFLIAAELSHLAAEVETFVGMQMHSSKHHHDLPNAVTTHFEDNVKKLKEVFKENNPFKEMELLTILSQKLSCKTRLKIQFSQVIKMA